VVRNNEPAVVKSLVSSVGLVVSGFCVSMGVFVFCIFK